MTDLQMFSSYVGSLPGYAAKALSTIPLWCSFRPFVIVLAFLECSFFIATLKCNPYSTSNRIWPACPGGSVVKNLPASSGDARDAGSILTSGRFPGEGNGNPLFFFFFCNPLFLPGKFHGQTSLVDYNPGGCIIRHDGSWTQVACWGLKIVISLVLPKLMWAFFVFVFFLVYFRRSCLVLNMYVNCHPWCVTFHMNWA